MYVYMPQGLANSPSNQLLALASNGSFSTPQRQTTLKYSLQYIYLFLWTHARARTHTNTRIGACPHTHAHTQANAFC